VPTKRHIVPVPLPHKGKTDTHRQQKKISERQECSRQLLNLRRTIDGVLENLTPSSKDKQLSSKQKPSVNDGLQPGVNNKHAKNAREGGGESGGGVFPGKTIEKKNPMLRIELNEKAREGGRARSK